MRTWGGSGGASAGPSRRTGVASASIRRAASGRPREATLATTTLTRAWRIAKLSSSACQARFRGTTMAPAAMMP